MNDKAQTARILKRTLHVQKKSADNKRSNVGGGKRGRGEPPAKRGGHWNERRSGGGNRGGRFDSNRFSGNTDVYGGGFGVDQRYDQRHGRYGDLEVEIEEVDLIVIASVEIQMCMEEALVWIKDMIKDMEDMVVEEEWILKVWLQK